MPPERRRLVSLVRLGIAKGRDRRREDYLFDGAMAARLDDVEHAVHIDIETEPRVLAQRQCQETGQRKEAVDTVERVEQLMQPRDVAAHDPDPTFHASPKLAMEAPQENFAYTLLLSPDLSKPDALAVIDVKPGSPTFSQIARPLRRPVPLGPIAELRPRLPLTLEIDGTPLRILTLED